MGKAEGLSDFDRGHSVITRRLGASISEIARLVGFSRPIVVKTYTKWMSDSGTSSRRHGVSHPYIINKKVRWRFSPFVKHHRSLTVSQLTTQYNSWPIKMYRSTLTADQVLLANSPTLNSGTSRLDHGSMEEIFLVR